MALPRSVLTPLIVACGLFMENMDGTILSTSLPAIALDLHEDPIALKLALTSYMLSLAVFIPISGWAADRFGARNIFRGAIAVFVGGSIACGFAQTLGGFVLARILQGIGGAMMVPVGRLIILRTVEKRELVRSLAYLTIPALVGPVIGPPLGGFITTFAHWRWIFWINVPIGILGLILATLFLENVREPNPPPLDVGGFLLSSLGLSGLLLGFTAAGSGLIPVRIAFVMIAVGVVALAAYVYRSRRVLHPVIDLSLLRIPTFRTSVVGGSLFRIGVGAVPFLLPLMLQLGFGLSPFESGSLTFAAAAGALLMKTTAYRVLRRFGFRTTLLVNGAISSCFIAGCALFTPQTPHVLLIAVLLAGGFFRSLQFTSLNTIAYADINQDQMSRATSFASVAQQVSISAGVSVAAAVLETTRMVRGDASILNADFSVAFLVVGLLSGASVLGYIRLNKNAGAEMSGHSEEKAVLAPQSSSPNEKL